MSNTDVNHGLRAVEAALSTELGKPPRVVTERRGSSSYPLKPEDYAPPDARQDNVTRALGPLPPYVTHASDVSRSAAIAAHAVVVDYEKAAQAVEAMGRDYHEQAQAVIQKVIDTAQLIRDKGAEAFREVEMSSKIASEIGEAIQSLKGRMGLEDRLTAAPETPKPEEQSSEVRSS